MREQYPVQTHDLDLTVFAGGHLEGYSVTAEVFANMGDARELARLGVGADFYLGPGQRRYYEVYLYADRESTARPNLECEPGSEDAVDSLGKRVAQPPHSVAAAQHARRTCHFCCVDLSRLPAYRGSFGCTK